MKVICLTERMNVSESFRAGIRKVSDFEEFENVLNGSCMQKRKKKCNFF